MKNIILLVSLLGIVFSGLLMGSNEVEAKYIYQRNHKHSYYGPYRLKYKGLTMYPAGVPAGAYGCGEKKPCNAYVIETWY